MKIESLSTALLFIVIAAAQILILSHIRLFGFATPMLQVYFILLSRRGFPRWLLLLLGFVMGLLLDSFANTPGVGAASLTLIAMLQPLVLEAFMQRESDPELQPSMITMRPAGYILYAVIITIIYCLTFFTLENFSFFNWEQWLLSIVGCSLFTIFVIIIMEIVRPSHH